MIILYAYDFVHNLSVLLNSLKTAGMQMDDNQLFWKLDIRKLSQGHMWKSTNKLRIWLNFKTFPWVKNDDPNIILPPSMNNSLVHFFTLIL